MSKPMQKIIIATILGAIVLFLFDGVFQGIPNFGVRAVERLETNDLTSAKFSERTDRMTYLVTDKTVSFLVTKKAEYYNLKKFFIIEIVSVFVISFVFALVFTIIKIQNLREALILVNAFAIIASFAIHIPYMNWWGFSLSYTVGVVFKTILGWTLLSFVQYFFLFRSK